MNLPNALTLSRLGMAFVLLILLTVSAPFTKTMALLLFAVGGITDYLDGWLARNKYGVTAFGQLMDPLTDKVMVCAAFISLVELHLVSAIVAVIIITREFLVTGLRLLALNDGRVLAAGTWGKHKTIWQITAIVAILLGLAIREDMLVPHAPEALAWYDPRFLFVCHAVSALVALITVISGWKYLQEHSELISREL
jgi:CDP-diacylglycerol--glycerol-3-phosphate 3-phosphatidyltransferase